MVNVPACRDMIQQADGHFQIPEIRVWCHPHKAGKSGDDYYNVFKTFEEAVEFCKRTDEAEEVPLVAINGYELNLFEIGKPITE